jgi:regulator of sigma E protease
MTVIISIALFLAVLFVLILVHEWGHYIVAKLTGMRVDEFGIGFPPKLFSMKRGETEYTLNALPIGGFVRIYGENGDDEESDNTDKTRAFSARPKWAQILVLLAGVTMNMVFAWFLFVVILLSGVPSAVEEGKQSADAKLMITDVMPGSPADKVIPPQSIVTGATALDDTLLSLTPSAFSDFLAAHQNTEVLITYTNNNVTNTATLVPSSGVLSSTSTRPAIGVALALVDTVNYSFTEALVRASQQTVVTTKAITLGLGNLLKGMVTGTADYSQVSGPVGIVGYVGDAAAVGLTSLLYFMAIISINLAVINLLPVPALDGGRIIFVLIEAVIRRPLSPVWAGRVNLVGFTLLILLMILVTVNDILRLW